MDVAGKIRECAALVGIDLGVDPDEVYLRMAVAVAELERTPIYACMSIEINLAMLDDDARARYRAIWGQEWTDVPPIAGPNHDEPTYSTPLEQGSTMGATCHATPRARRAQ